MFEKPYYPIVYIRGYAMTMREVEETVADPYMGFNKGSTKIRQKHDRSVQRHIFESPLVRLMKDHGYCDIYEDGSEMPVEGEPPQRSIWIYRYYEASSEDFGDGKKHPIEQYAAGLYDFLLRIKKTYKAGDDFKVYLVAHSMGGLIARCYLQNIAPSKGLTAETCHVDKLFTYATPHNGIDIGAGLFNAPAIGALNIKNFNRKYMRKYLKISDGEKDVNTLDGKFPEERCFCLVGTNHRDYSAVQWVVGEMSDGLVRIENAVVKGCPRAFVYRSHSGHYGIVNSESGYQNLRRFLFGCVRVETLLDVKSISLPPEVEEKKKEKKKIRASYHIEVVGNVRGANWNLHRRKTRECSAIFGPYDRLVKKDRPIHLASTFLMHAPGDTGPQNLGFSLELNVLVPDYEVDGILFFDHHFEGAPLFRDVFCMEAVPVFDGAPEIRWGRQSETPNRMPNKATLSSQDKDVLEYRIPVKHDRKPGIEADLVVRTSYWNR